MRTPRVACALLALLLIASLAPAQNPLRDPSPRGPAGPDQPVRPEAPVIRQRGAPPEQSPGGQQPRGQCPNGQYPARPQQPPPPPFRLTPQEEAQVDRVLNLWEQHNRGIKKFDCQFKRWIYDAVFGRPGVPTFIESGIIRFATPDKGLFKIESSERNGKTQPIEDSRAEHWLCDGKAVYEYRPAQKRVEEHRLPPELQGKAIAHSPLPFLFGAEAQSLKQRYFIRVATPPGVDDQIWLEAYPRSQQDAANFHHATFAISAKDLSPYALMLVQPNGKDVTNYQFYHIVVNDPLGVFRSNPFRPFTPDGWKFVPDAHPPQNANPHPQAARPLLRGQR